MGEHAVIRRALLSVSDKTSLASFARGLTDLGVQIISTGGTAAALRESGIEVIPIESVTGFPEMMDGRVKTLHPAVHGAILGRRDRESHVQALTDHDITPIDLVCINLYPFEQTIQDENVSFDDAIEQIDIGGPALLRSAAKNHEFVTVVTSASQYDRVINDMEQNEGATSPELRRELAAAAFMRTAEYDTAISAWMSRQRLAPSGAPMGTGLLHLNYGWSRDLRYGENPHQIAALYSNPTFHEPSVVSARQLHGRELSYNNILDAAAALELALELRDQYQERSVAAIIKHANPCGAAIADTGADAFAKARDCDPLAAYGGIVALGQAVDDATAEQLCGEGVFIEVVIAPEYQPAALERLQERWKNQRLLEITGGPRTSTNRFDYRSVPGGMLVQERDDAPTNTRKWQHAGGPLPDDETMQEAVFAWTLAKHLKSNAIAITRDGQLLGAGPGQVDRVNACRIAIEKAGGSLPGKGVTVAASDAFFPFPDGPTLLIDAGATCLVHPGGSKRDAETIALCEKRGVTCLLTGMRHFRH